MTSEQTNWYVITGGPYSGKTSVINYLAYLGYSIRPEVARIIIDEEISKGRKLEDIRNDEINFLKEITPLKIKMEDSIHPEQLIFLDRGIPDDIAYLRFYKSDYSFQLEVANKRRYKGVFLLEMIPNYSLDYSRIEDKEAAKKIHEEIFKTYTDLGYKVVRIPLIPIPERINQILECVQESVFWIAKK